MGKISDQRQPVSRDNYIQNEGETKSFWRETLWYRDDVAAETTKADIKRFRSDFETAASPEAKFFAFQQELMTETMAAAPEREKDRQLTVEAIHEVITAPTNDQDLPPEHYDAIALWVQDINSQDKVNGLYPMYQKESYAIPEALSDLYSSEQKNQIDGLLNELERKNTSIAQANEAELTLQLTDTTSKFEEAMRQQPLDQDKMQLLNQAHDELDKQGDIKAKLERFTGFTNELEANQNKQADGPSKEAKQPKEKSSGGGLWSAFKNAVKSVFKGIIKAVSSAFSSEQDDRTPEQRVADLDNTLDELGIIPKTKQKTVEKQPELSKEDKALAKQAPDKAQEVLGIKEDRRKNSAKRAAVEAGFLPVDAVRGPENQRELEAKGRKYNASLDDVGLNESKEKQAEVSKLKAAKQEQQV